MPQNWKTYKLEDLGMIVTGKTPSSKFPEDYGDDTPFVTPTDFSNFHKHATHTARNLSVIGREKLSKKVLPPNSVLVTCIGSQMGKVTINKQDVVTNQQLNSIIINGKVDSDYLYYKLISIHEDLRTIAGGGSTMPLLNKTDFENIEITIPPLPEQCAITSILSALDDKIENNLVMNKTLEDMAMALYKHWFVDGIIDKPSTLRDFVDLNPRLSIKKGSIAPYVNMKSLPTEGMSVSDFERAKVKGGAKFQNGDTLFARITPCLENGKTAFVDFLDGGEVGFGSTEFLVFRVKKGVSKYWAYCLSREQNFVNHAVSTMIGTSGRQRVQNDPLLQYELPEIDLDAMANFDNRVKPWFNQVKNNTDENQTLTQLRNTLLPKLISGEVRVKDVEKEIQQAV